MGKYTTLLMDLDGTIVNTNELIIESCLHVLKDEPNAERFTREYIAQHLGLPLREQLAELSGLSEVDHLVNAYRAFNVANHDRWVKPFPFVQETLAALYQSGIRMGVVTSKINKTAVMGLQLTGLLPFVEVIVSEDMVKKTKPDAEPILTALDFLQADPEQTAMLGDSHYDILSAKNARIASIAVGWSLKGEAFLRTYSPDYLINDIRELTQIINPE